MAPEQATNPGYPPRDLVTLITDFGTGDPYVGVMKGVMLSVAPWLRFVDITHEVGPQNVREGAFVLATSWRYFPPGTVHLAVVDPGVGTERRPILLAGPEAFFVGPDNGLFGWVFGPPWEDHPEAGPRPLPEGWRAFVLNQPRFWRPDISRTFHGRDIFGPAAAHLAAGVRPEELGTPVGAVTALAWPRPIPAPGPALRGEVVYVDRFGNLVTNIPAKLVSPSAWVEVAGRTIRGLSRTYAEAKELATLVNSFGLLEVAVPGGNAAAALKAGPGTPVIVREGGGP